MDCILGIDPGLKGGLALVGLDGEILGLAPMPWTHSVLNTVDHVVIRKFVGERKPFGYVERAHAMPAQGVVSVFSYGVGFGCILGILSTISVGWTLVGASTWKKSYGLGAQKRLSIGLAKQMYPDLDLGSGKHHKDHDGMAEALLIARWGLAHWLSNQARLKEMKDAKVADRSRTHEEVCRATANVNFKHGRRRPSARRPNGEGIWPGD